MSVVSFARTRPRLFWSLIAALVVALYLSSLGVYAASDDSGAGWTEVTPDADEVLVIVSLIEVRPSTSRVDVEVSVAPGASFLDSGGADLAREMTVLVSPSIARTKLVLPQGTSVTTFDTQVLLDGQAGRWPFDRFVVDPLVVTAYTGSGSDVQTHPTRVLVDGEAEGWTVGDDVLSADGQDVQEVRVEVHRSGGILVYSALLLAMMVILAALAAFVSIQTARRRRVVHTDMLGWMAAMVFAVIPMRNILPGAPPIGAWVDITVTVWVIVTLVVSLALYVYCWWRDTAGETVSGGGRQLRGGVGDSGAETGPPAEGQRHRDHHGECPPHVGRREELVPQRPAGSVPAADAELPVRGEDEQHETGSDGGAEDDAAAPVGGHGEDHQQRRDPDPVV
ncbi:DUF4436 domain-containing protein [Rhodococcus hoagii]|nr:DUF4436 domain-containing protein [Prescottella equi]